MAAAVEHVDQANNKTATWNIKRRTIFFALLTRVSIVLLYVLRGDASPFYMKLKGLYMLYLFLLSVWFFLILLTFPCWILTKVRGDLWREMKTYFVWQDLVLFVYRKEINFVIKVERVLSKGDNIL